MLFFSPIPHREVKHDARKESTLSHTENEARGEESSHILGDAQQRGDYAPSECECRKPHFGRCQFQNDIAWYLCESAHHAKLIVRVKTHFEEDIADEIQGQAGQVLISGWGKSSIWVTVNKLEACAAYSYASLPPNPPHAHWQLRRSQQLTPESLVLGDATVAAVQKGQKIQEG